MHQLWTLQKFSGSDKFQPKPLICFGLTLSLQIPSFWLELKPYNCTKNPGTLPGSGFATFLILPTTPQIILDIYLLRRHFHTWCWTSDNTTNNTSYQQNSLPISKKSSIEPSQNVQWLGKIVSLTQRQICNTNTTMIQTIARCLLIASSPIFDKKIDILFGHLLWATRPLKGVSSIIQSWYLQRWHGRRYLPLLTGGMTRSLFDATILACSPCQAKDNIPPPFLTHIRSCCKIRYAILYWPILTYFWS